jgi:ABC-type amino acid transport substrate-binding protein
MKPKATLSVLLAGLLAAAALAIAPAPTQAQEQLTGTLAKARESGAITIGYRESSVPFSYLNARKEPIGYSIELCRALVTAIEDAVNKSLAIKWVPVTSDSRIDAVASGKVDLECGSTTNNLERQKRVSFSPTMFVSGTKVLLYGLIAQDAAKADYEVVGDFLSYDPYGIMYRKGDAPLAKVVNDTFQVLAEDGEIERQYKRWFLRKLPSGESINLPMSAQLETIIQTMSVKAE